MVKRQWSDLEIEYLKTHRKEDTIEYIGSILGRSISSVQAKSLRLGLGYVSKNAFPGKELNTDFFKTWTSEMAYMFGYWLADGNMSRIDGNKSRQRYSVTFVSKDKEHLQKVRKAFKSTHKILTIDDGTYKISMTRKALWLGLYARGGRPAKSLTVVWPDIPMNFIIDFIRGYVDGDGCLYLRRTIQISPTLTIAGTKQFLQSMSDIVYSFTGIISQRVRQLYNSRAYELRYSGVKAKCFAYWLYSNSELHLERKYVLYQEFMKWYPKQVKRKFITDKMLSLFSSLIEI